MQGVQVHSVQTPLRETKPLLFIRLQNEAASGMLAVKLEGGVAASLFARDVGRSPRAAAWVEDERDLGSPSTLCVRQTKYRLIRC